MTKETQPIGVLHLIDTLDLGGAERVAVNLVNSLPRNRYQVHLCTTRRDGPLSKYVNTDVGRLTLGRTVRLEYAALRRLRNYISEHQIRILHPHNAALFLAVLMSLLPPFPMVVWHDHSGRRLKGPVLPFRVLATRIAAVICVNEQLATWAKKKLRLREDMVTYIPNFVEAIEDQPRQLELPGARGFRIACVANLRVQKDQVTLVRAMALVIQRIPSAHLLLVGSAASVEYERCVREEIAELGLERHVSFLGRRDDVAAILAACDVGVLSSSSEGLPLALLEYGAAGVPAVSTRVGQCPEVLDDGGAGRLVQPEQPEDLADALIELLANRDRLDAFGERLRHRIASCYSPQVAIRMVDRVYRSLLTSGEES